MDKKGFTLIEVLVTFVIIALISGIGIISYKTFFDSGEKSYYKSIEQDIILAASDYFLDNRDLLPVSSSYKEVDLNNLIEKKYIEEVKSSRGNSCGGTIIAYRENGKYGYDVCLECENYKTKGKYCKDESGNTIATKKITITGRTESGKTYNPNLNYENVEQTSENVIITFNVESSEVGRYEIVNTGTNEKMICTPTSGNTCEKEISKGGTYSVTSYNKEGKVIISNQSFSVRKIAKNLGFTIYGIKENNKISESVCNGSKKLKLTFSIRKNLDKLNEEYKKVEYKLEKITKDGVREERINKEIKGLSDSFDLESGHYELTVRVTNFADEVTESITPFNVTYDVNLNYDDDTTIYKHEVVQGYSYDYVKKLPTLKDAYGAENLEVKWEKNGTRIYGSTIVEEDCSHTIIGKMAIPVNIPTNLTSYCADVTYNGSEQTLTTTPPENITFLNSKQTDAGDYIVKAHVNFPLYIWSDGTSADKTFTCSIQKLKCATPTNISMASDGKITWSASSNCSSAGHQISFDNSTWEDATSGVDKKSTLIASTGDKTVYVKAIKPNNNYITSDSGTGTTTVYSLTINKGTESDHFTVSGNGNYIKGASATLTASFENPYYFVNWKKDSSVVSTTNGYSISNISSNLTYTANVGNGCADGNYTQSCSNSCPSICYGSTGTGTKTCERISNVITDYDCGTTKDYITCNGNTDCRSWHSQEDYYSTCYCGSCSGYMHCLKKCQYMYNSSTWACTSSSSTRPSWDSQTDGQWCWCKY